ncbi:unnamed protein product, partial [Candidula unifasciata]
EVSSRCEVRNTTLNHPRIHRRHHPKCRRHHLLANHHTRRRTGRTYFEVDVISSPNCPPQISTHLPTVALL